MIFPISPPTASASLLLPNNPQASSIIVNSFFCCRRDAHLPTIELKEIGVDFSKFLADSIC
uniref:Uncharacterized protein n=1 Tax=Nelumbo nucifera TaxID=4432 RepID=A0A822XGS4_NELNU|nr:TPA_asm: hypothetical protein HUJ06_019498 [Nelumbo nucifera]